MVWESTKNITESVCVRVCVSSWPVNYSVLCWLIWLILFGGWSGWVMATMPSDSAQIGHQRVLLECKRWFFSSVLDLISLILCWEVSVDHSSLATRWCQNRPPGGPLECKSCFFSVFCGPIWLILCWMVRVGHSYLGTRWCPNWPPGAPLECKICFSPAIFGLIWLILC